MAAKRPAAEWFKFAESGNEVMIAVAAVYGDMEATGGEPGSDGWLTNKKRFRRLKAKIVGVWAKATGLNPDDYPFNKDFTRWAWITFRKGKERKEKINAWARGQQPLLFEDIPYPKSPPVTSVDDDDPTDLERNDDTAGA